MKKLINILVVFAMVVPLALTSCKGKTEKDATSLSSNKNEVSSKGSIPKALGEATILLSEQIYGDKKTVNELFGKPKETTKLAVTSKKNEMTISSRIMKDGSVALKYDVTFIFSDNGTCYPAKLYYEMPSTFQSDTIICDGGPYKDPRGFGQVFGWLKELLPVSYD